MSFIGKYVYDKIFPFVLEMAFVGQNYSLMCLRKTWLESDCFAFLKKAWILFDERSYNTFLDKTVVSFFFNQAQEAQGILWTIQLPMKEENQILIG